MSKATNLEEKGLATEKYNKAAKMIHYNPETGVFTWKVKYCKKVVVGSSVGSVNNNGYYEAKVLGSRIYLHRLAWFIYYKNMPKNQIDHINGIPTDNRILNIRDVTPAENMKNQKTPKSNVTGSIGVHYYKDKTGKKWRARVKVDRVDIHIGYFNSKEAAEKASKSKRCELGFHTNHGRK